MAVVFLLGLLVSSLMERRAEVASVFNNKRTEFTDSIIAQNEKFKADYPREYETWAMTEDTSFVSKASGFVRMATSRNSLSRKGTRPSTPQAERLLLARRQS